MATITGTEQQGSKQRDFPRPDNLDPQKLEILYDHELDTLFVHLFGHERRATNRLAGDYAYYRVDPQTESVVGLQIEGFLRRAVKEHPELIELLRYAELRGVSFDQVQRESTNAIPSPRRWLMRAKTSIGLMLSTSVEQPTRQAIAALRLYLPGDSDDAKVREQMHSKPCQDSVVD